jgi:hypothetical protein
MQWVDPSAIELYQRYINYLEDVIRLVKTIDLWGPMVFKTNTSCENEYYTYS